MCFFFVTFKIACRVSSIQGKQEPLPASLLGLRCTLALGLLYESHGLVVSFLYLPVQSLMQGLILHLHPLTLFACSPWQVTDLGFLSATLSHTVPGQWHSSSAGDVAFLALCGSITEKPSSFLLLLAPQNTSWVLGVGMMRRCASNRIDLVQVPVSANGAPVEGSQQRGPKSQGRAFIEILLPIYKAELELVRVTWQLGAWFSSSLVKRKEEAELDYSKEGVERINWTIINFIFWDSSNCGAF